MCVLVVNGTKMNRPKRIVLEPSLTSTADFEFPGGLETGGIINNPYSGSQGERVEEQHLLINWHLALGPFRNEYFRKDENTCFNRCISAKYLIQ